MVAQGLAPRGGRFRVFLLRLHPNRVHERALDKEAVLTTALGDLEMLEKDRARAAAPRPWSVRLRPSRKASSGKWTQSAIQRLRGLPLITDSDRDSSSQAYTTAEASLRHVSVRSSIASSSVDVGGVGLD